MFRLKKALWFILVTLLAIGLHGNAVADVGNHWHSVAGPASETPGVQTDSHCNNRISAGESCALLTTAIIVTPALQIITPGAHCTMLQATANTVEMQQGMGTLYVTPPGYILTLANDYATTADTNGIWQSIRGDITGHTAAGLIYVNCK